MTRNTLIEKPHYPLLDGLRGVAALMVICYHLTEGFAESPATQAVNHGYLAVDFFFALSGFVIGYAYDDRWKNGSVTTMGFFKRRLIRLHPMVVMGVLLGLFTFLLQGGVKWDGTSVAPAAIALAAFLSLFMLPALPGSVADIRGNNELFPLNGPMWSLFFEYIGNIFYALFIRRLRTRHLALLTALLGAGVVAVALRNNMMGVGWTLSGDGLWGGLVRMLFSYTAGMLISRTLRPVKVRGAFWLCAAAIAVFVSLPYMGTESRPWLNGLYDAACILFLFPLIVWIAASTPHCGAAAEKCCKHLGELSYPLYLVHYPFFYLFYAWLWNGGNNRPSLFSVWPVALLLVVFCLLLTWAVCKYYDLPVRRWLSRKLG